MFSKVFLLDVTERAIKTFAQVLLSALTMENANVFELSWSQMLKLAVSASVVSVLTSIVSSGLRERGTASLVVNPPLPPPADKDVRG